MKINRQAVYDKYHGHCAYCGGKITVRQMEVDHMWPQCLAHLKPDEDNNAFENLMPSCKSCNIHKHGMPLDRADHVVGGWRRVLGMQLSMLTKRSAQFRRLLKFGQVMTTEKPIVFFL